MYTKMKIVFIIASPSDEPWADKIKQHLKKWELDTVTHMASAHKVPERVFSIIEEHNKEKDLVYVTIAGRSNGLSGVVAANSVHPVIACPPFADKTDMLVNIQSTLQMPSDSFSSWCKATPICSLIFSLSRVWLSRSFRCLSRSAISPERATSEDSCRSHSARSCCSRVIRD